MTIPAGVDREDLQYGYIPTAWICYLFAGLFLFSTILHLGQTIYFKMWWPLATIILAGIGETIGWAGRVWSSQSYLGNARTPFLIQICCTIIAPTPLLAANFIVLGVIIGHLGAQYSRLTPKWYTIIFLSADIVALVVQAIGGASASAASNEPDGDPSTGGNIMLGGIIFQLIVICVYSALAIEYFYRFLNDKPVRDSFDSFKRHFDRRIQFMAAALAFTTLCLFIRAIYRTIELADGWNGRIIETEVYFNVLDGAMIVLAIYSFNFFHPGLMLKHVYASRAAPKDIQSSQDDVTLAQPGYAPFTVDKEKAGNNTTSASMRAV